MPFETTTQRLIIKEFSVEDAEALYKLHLDPEVMKYVGESPFASVDVARDSILNYESYKKDGFGRWGVHLKTTNELIGWSGLKFIDEFGLVDIGYRYFKSQWGKGYATEAGKACLKAAFCTYDLKEIIGTAMHENSASIHVLEKLGMTYWKDVVCEAHPAKCYKITSTEFCSMK